MQKLIKSLEGHKTAAGLVGLVAVGIINGSVDISKILTDISGIIASIIVLIGAIHKLQRSASKLIGTKGEQSGR